VSLSSLRYTLDIYSSPSRPCLSSHVLTLPFLHLRFRSTYSTFYPTYDHPLCPESELVQTDQHICSPASLSGSKTHQLLTKSKGAQPFVIYPLWIVKSVEARKSLPENDFVLLSGTEVLTLSLDQSMAEADLFLL
jgi:hypothetical protein